MFPRCPECQTEWLNNLTCQEYFNQMLFWENENPNYGAEVHHLMVLCYYLQHPSLYSMEGLAHAQQLLIDFWEYKQTPAEIRKRNQAKVNSHQRKWKIKGTATAYGVYVHPPKWRMTAAEVVAGGADNYCDNVKKWAQAINDDLKASGNFSIP